MHVTENLSETPVSVKWSGFKADTTGKVHLASVSVKPTWEHYEASQVSFRHDSFPLFWHAWSELCFPFLQHYVQTSTLSNVFCTSLKVTTISLSHLLTPAALITYLSAPFHPVLSQGSTFSNSGRKNTLTHKLPFYLPLSADTANRTRYFCLLS